MNASDSDNSSLYGDMRRGNTVKKMSVPVWFRMVLPVVVLSGCLLLTVVLYYPGLNGPFIFDDIPNLSPMGKYPWLDPWSRLIIFVSSGESGPTGRPLSLLTFWLNDFAWPSDPRSFEYTNLMIHLLNGVLIFWFVIKLLERREGMERSAWVAAIVSLIWLVHPLHLTAVLFIIQRMTEMSALFILCGVIAYLYGRERVIQTGGRGYVYLTIMLLVFGLLAVFSKENGSLLLVYILVIEYFFMRPMYADRPGGYGMWSGIVLVMPLLLLGLYVLYSAKFGGAYELRPFSLGERLLSESRVVMDYLKQFVVPDLGGSGLFHDDFPISTGLLQPPSTLVSILLVLMFLMVSLLKECRESLLSFAILWFFAGHLLESTILPLELYFEHRNYLPILGFVIVAVIWVFRLQGRLRWLIRGGMVIWVLMLAFILNDNARLWGAADREGMLWAIERPNSIRAQEVAREVWLAFGRPDKAREHVLEITRLHPGNGMAMIQRLLFDCEYGYLDKRSLEEIIVGMRSVSYAAALVGNMKNVAAQAESGACAALTRDTFSRFLNAFAENPNYQSGYSRFVLAYFRGLEFAGRGQLDSAMRSLQQAYDISPNLDILLHQVAVLYSAGLYKEALARIETVRYRNGGVELGLALKVRRDEIDRLVKNLLEHIEQDGRSGQGI